MKDDLISRKSALTEIRKDGKWLEEQGVTSMTTHERELRDTFILREMSSAQSADAVEVVRCKDCEHDKYCCRIIRSSGRLESDFCSYGERRSDG